MKTNPYTPFYGYNEETLARICLISLSYAKRLKKGEAKASPQVLELFSQYAEQRTPGKEWKDWRFTGSSLWTPEDREVSQGDIRALPYLLQLQAETTRVRQRKTNEGNSTSCIILNFRRDLRMDRK